MTDLSIRIMFILKFLILLILDHLIALYLNQQTYAMPILHVMPNVVQVFVCETWLLYK